jgi:hypothetical protein
MDTNWRVREECRMADGTYKLVPWHREEWWAPLVAPGGALAEHYTHASTEDGAQVAFTENEQKGMRDRQTRMKPGRYLARFCAFLSADTVREWSGKFAAEFDESLQFAHTADEIEEIYTSGPRSCMSESASQYSSPEHPVRVYAAGDLALAYVRRDGEISGRALVWPANMVHSRIYGDCDRMAAALTAAGYSLGSLEGARLRRVKLDDNAFVCPYIDRDSNVRDDGIHLIIDSGGDLESNTSGVAGETGHPCGNCGERYDDDNLYYHDSLNMSVCGSCEGDLLRSCDECDELYPNDDVIHYAEAARHGRDLCESCRDGQLFNCNSCNEWVSNDNLTVNADGESLCEPCLASYYTRCEPCGEWHHDSAVDSERYCSSCASEAKPDEPYDDSECDGASTAIVQVVLPIGGGETAVIYAIPTDTPGLCAHRILVDGRLTSGREWTLTHMPSGLRVSSRGLAGKDTALAMASALAELCDWTMPDPMDSPERRERIRVARDAFEASNA